MQTPRIPGGSVVTGAAKEAGSTASAAISGLKSIPALPNVSAPAILLPPGVHVPARTIAGKVPAKVRDLARFGALASQKIGTLRRAGVASVPHTPPNQHPYTKPPVPPPPTTKPLPVGPPIVSNPPVRTQPIFGQSSASVRKPTEKAIAKTPLSRTDGDRAMNPTGTPAFMVPGTVAGEGSDITRGMLSALDDIGDIMTFEYNPEEISVDHAGGWIITDQPGRAHPFIQFGGGGQRRISFTLRLFYTHNEVGDVLQNVNWLHSFLMGREQGSGISGAPRYLHTPKSMRLKLGRLFDGVPCILTKASVTYKTLFRPTSLLPLYAEVALELLEIGGTGGADTYAERRGNAAAAMANAQGLNIAPRLANTATAGAT